jgi:hypothetical protein
MRHQVVRKSLLLSLILIPVACNNNATQFSDALSSAIAKGDGTIVEFRKLTRFEWDKVYIYGPYTSHDHINAKHGTKLRGNNLIHSILVGEDEVPENEYVLIFRARSEVAAVVRWPRHCGDFSIERWENNEAAYTPEDAVFRIAPAGREGALHLVEAGASGP